MLKISTKIEVSQGVSYSTKTVSMENETVGRVNASSPIIVDEMIYDRVDCKSWTLDSTSGPAFNLDIFSLLDLSDPNEMKFLHVQSKSFIEKIDDVVEPVRFDVNLGGVDLGSMSQFQLTNMENFTPDSLTITNVNVQSGKKAYFTVFFAIK